MCSTFAARFASFLYFFALHSTPLSSPTPSAAPIDVPSNASTRFPASRPPFPQFLRFLRFLRSGGCRRRRFRGWRGPSACPSSKRTSWKSAPRTAPILAARRRRRAPGSDSRAAPRDRRRSASCPPAPPAASTSRSPRNCPLRPQNGGISGFAGR